MLHRMNHTIAPVAHARPRSGLRAAARVTFGVFRFAFYVIERIATALSFLIGGLFRFVFIMTRMY
jgi:hypothetical protein